MNTGELHKLASSVERFLTMAGLPDDAARTATEEEIVNRMAADSTKKPFLVSSSKGVALYSNDILVKNYGTTGMGAKDGQVLHCDGRKISLLDATAYLGAGAIAITGLAAGEAEAQRNGRWSGGTDTSCNNNNNNNNG